MDPWLWRYGEASFFLVLFIPQSHFLSEGLDPMWKIHQSINSSIHEFYRSNIEHSPEKMFCSGTYTYYLYSAVRRVKNTRAGIIHLSWCLDKKELKGKAVAENCAHVEYPQKRRIWWKHCFSCTQIQGTLSMFWGNEFLLALCPTQILPIG